MTKTTSEFTGDIPENYDQRLGPIIFAPYANDIARRAGALKPARVLELAAGTGIVSRKLKDALGPDAHLTVTDLNAPMLEVAKAKFRDGENAAFQTADAMKLDFPDDFFDLIVCQFGVMFFPDKIASFGEAVRVLRPGGAYLFSCWGSLSENPFAQIAQGASEKFFSENPPGFYRIPFSYPDPDAVRKDLLEAGFDDVQHETIEFQKTVPDWRHFSHGVVFGNPLIDEIKSRGGVDANDVARAVENGLRKEFGPEPSSMPLKATIFKGRSP